MMNEKTCNYDQMKVAKKVIEIIARVPQERRFLVTIAAEAFVNGMEAQERLTSQTAERPKT